MPPIRLASQNCEWMNNFFGADSEPAAWLKTGKLDGSSFSVDDASRRLAGLLLSLDADVICIQEAPSRPAELELFVERYLRQAGAPAYDYLLGDTGGQQKIGVLFRPPAKVTLLPADTIPELVEPWEADIDGDGFLEPYAFTRTPLALRVAVGQRSFTLLALHTKSNFVNQGEKLWRDPTRRQEYVLAALKSRRRISSEATRTRQLIERLLDSDPAASIVVAGDLNDGPGLDYFETRYLTHNVIDILVGSALNPERLFRHAQHDVPAPQRYSAEFDDFVENVKHRKLLLDHIILSPGMEHAPGFRYVPGSGRIHHAEYDAQITGTGARRDKRPTDHRPVSVDLE